jgi:germacradienol/geosmin synthase
MYPAEVLEEPLYDIGNNPIDYLARQRESGIGPRVASMVEHAAGAPLPAAIAGSAPMRALRDAFADVVHLHTGGVRVLERFFGYAPQRAADTVHDLIAARLRHFDHIVHSELSALRPEVAGYVQGLRDWLSGLRERPGPTGLRTSATRIRSLLGRAGAELLSPARPLASPNLHLPYLSRANPALDAVRRHAVHWAADMGMLTGEVWTEQCFHAMDFGLFAALTHPDAELAELELVNDWQVWSRYSDGVAGAGTRPGRRGLADLLSRSGSDSRVADQVAILDENRARLREQDPIELLERRRADGVFAALLVRRTAGADPAMEPALVDAFADLATLHGDLFRYPREFGKPGNTVLAVQRFLDCTLAEAVKVVSDLSARRFHRFEHFAAAAANVSYVDSLRDWLAGHLVWHQVRTPAGMGGFRDRVVG